MGWMSAPLPVYLRQFHAEDPHFAGTKLVYSLFDNGFKGCLDDGLEQGMAFDGVNNPELFNQATADSLYCQALRSVDAVLEMSDLAPAAAIAAAKEAGVPVHDGRPFMEQPALLDAFYESLFA
jgi:starch synthase